MVSEPASDRAQRCDRLLRLREVDEVLTARWRAATLASCNTCGQCIWDYRLSLAAREVGCEIATSCSQGCGRSFYATTRLRPAHKGGRRTAQVASLLASPSLRRSPSGTSSSISGKSCRSSSRTCASSSSPAAANVSRSTMPAATAISSLRANPSSCTCWTRASRSGAGCDGTCLSRSGKSSSSSSRRCSRSSFLKNSTNSLAAMSRAEASPSLPALRSRDACTSPW